MCMPRLMFMSRFVNYIIIGLLVVVLLACININLEAKLLRVSPTPTLPTSGSAPRASAASAG